MKDVAAHAGVAVKTVSRVVNGEPYVSEDIRVRVQSAIAFLGYKHDARAGSLKRGALRSSTIGLLQGTLDNPFSSAIHSEVFRVAIDRGWVVIAGGLDGNEEHERKAFEGILTQRVEGLIVCTSTHDLAHLRNEQEHGIAVVVVDGDAGTLDNVDVINSDNRGGGEAAVAHLMARGHRDIAYIGPRHDVYTISERRRGFLGAARRAGLTVPDPWLLDDVDSRSVAGRLVHLFDSDTPPTAVFSAQNRVTMDVIQELHQIGKHHEIAVVGFDDFPLSNVVDPGVTVLSQDVTCIGALATQRLLTRIAQPMAESTMTTVPVTLIPRGSGEIPPPNR